MKTLKGILSFDPNTDTCATFNVLDPSPIGGVKDIEWSHDPQDAGRHLGKLTGAFPPGTNGFTSSFLLGTTMTIEPSADGDYVIVQLWDKDGTEYETGFTTLIEIVAP